jgi:hypothetical protein
LNDYNPLTAEDRHSALPPKLVINSLQHVENRKSGTAKASIYSVICQPNLDTKTKGATVIKFMFPS